MPEIPGNASCRQRGGRTTKRKACIVLFWLLIWHLAAVFTDNQILLPTPLQTLDRLGELLAAKEFYFSAAGSLLRIAGGFFLGALFGFLFASAAGRSRLFEEMLAPVMRLFQTAPVASLAVLLLIWWGSSMLAVAVCFLVVFPGIYFNTLEGIRSTDAELLQMAGVFGLPRHSRFFYIYRPALKPFVTGGFKTALGMCWKSGVAAEVIGTPSFSLGERLFLSKLYLDTAGVFAWTAVMILLSYGFEKIILRLTKQFFAWEPPCRKAGGGHMPGKTKGGGIVCLGVEKRYGNLKVLENFNREYLPGKIYYLREASGSGKTTLLKLLCGLERPDAGRIERSGRCSVMFQEDRLCREYSAVKNIEMVTGDSEEAKKALGILLEKEALDKPCSALSGGMRRRVALVRAMEAESDIVLLDEPFSGLDGAARQRAEEYILQKQAGRLIVIASHI